MRNAHYTTLLARETLRPSIDLLSVVDLPNAALSPSRSGTGGGISRLLDEVVLDRTGGDEGIGIPDSEGRRRIETPNPFPFPLLDLLLVEALPSNIGVAPLETSVVAVTG